MRLARKLGAPRDLVANATNISKVDRRYPMYTGKIHTEGDRAWHPNHAVTAEKHARKWVGFAAG